jgi:hypothetical protein
MLGLGEKSQRCICAGRFAVLLLTVGGAAIPTTGNAKVNIEGTATEVRVTTSQDAISDVLDAFSAIFNLRYRTSAPLDAVISGIYSGSTERVISRILAGYDFTIGHNGKVIEISVYGKSLGATSANPGPRPVEATPALAPVPSPEVALVQGPAPGRPPISRRDDSYERRRQESARVQRLDHP